MKIKIIFKKDLDLSGVYMVEQDIVKSIIQ